MTQFETDLYARSFFLADHAAVENGKLYTNGACWNRLHYQSFPAVAHVAVVAVLDIPWRARLQNHKFTIWFEDADAKRLGGELSGEFAIGKPADMRDGDDSIVPISAMINNLTIENPGDYAAVLSVDGEELSRWRFRAIKVAPAS